MEKEKWINEVMNSTSGLQKAEPSPFLFEKITARIQQTNSAPKTVSVLFRTKFAVGFAAAALLITNGIAIATFVSTDQVASNTQSDPNKEIVTTLSQELGYSSSYNY